MFSVGVDGLQKILFVFESSVFEIVFPQFRRTGETSRVFDVSEMLDSLSFQSLVDHFRRKGFLFKLFPACCVTRVGLVSYFRVLFLIRRMLGFWDLSTRRNSL